MVRENNVLNGSQQPAIVITQTTYDKRALTCTDTNALAISLQNLNYLTSVNTPAVSSMMASDGGLSLLVSILRRYGRRLNGVREDLDPFDSKPLTESSSLVVTPTCPTGEPQHSIELPQPELSSAISTAAEAAEQQLLAQVTSVHKSRTENLDRFIYSTALACLTNIATRGRQRMKEALVECGIVPVLVELLDHVVVTMEMVQALQGSLSQKSVVHKDSNSSSADCRSSTPGSVTAMDVDSSADSLPPTSGATSAGSLLVGNTVLQSSDLEVPTFPAAASSAMTGESTASAQVGLLPTFAAPVQPQSSPQQPSASAPSTHPHEISLLPSIRHTPQTHLEATLVASVSYRAIDILLAIRLISILSKYPSLRPHLHADSLRPRRPTLEAMILAASAANDAAKKVGPLANPPTDVDDPNATIADFFQPIVLPTSKDENVGGGTSPLQVSALISGLGLSHLDDASEEIEELLDSAGVGAAGPIFMQNPLNPRCAFELVEAFTSPSSYLAEARIFAITALRNAYRRDPSTAVLTVPQQDGASATMNSAGSVVVSPGQLRRCAYARCGKWEDRYKQFSKCSRCRRVTYCCKTCQRRAWVLHKNWCLKFSGEPQNNSSSAIAANSAGETVDDGTTVLGGPVVSRLGIGIDIPSEESFGDHQSLEGVPLHSVVDTLDNRNEDPMDTEASTLPLVPAPPVSPSVAPDVGDPISLVGGSGPTSLRSTSFSAFGGFRTDLDRRGSEAAASTAPGAAHLATTPLATVGFRENLFQ
ncbi:hypothetical protein DFJ73DRAFT_26127 [Zopfochytrium polystomum]|nr:hypothetical protein DFJ73DRAFT_26127 [Zopfochytrium polystomum]